MSLGEMSLGKEARIEQCIEEMVQYDRAKQLAIEKKWYKNGKAIEVKDMDDRYIQNCINWIKRNDETDLYYDHLHMFEEELNRRSRMKKMKEKMNEIKSENKDMLDTFMSILEAAGLLNGWTEFTNK